MSNKANKISYNSFFICTRVSEFNFNLIGHIETLTFNVGFKKNTFYVERSALTRKSTDSLNGQGNLQIHWTV